MSDESSNGLSCAAALRKIEQMGRDFRLNYPHLFSDEKTDGKPVEDPFWAKAFMAFAEGIKPKDFSF